MVLPFIASSLAGWEEPALGGGLAKNLLVVGKWDFLPKLAAPGFMVKFSKAQEHKEQSGWR